MIARNSSEQIIFKFLVPWWWLRMLAIALLLVCCFSFPVSPTAEARLDREQEVSGPMLYRSFQSLRDAEGRPWQAIAFKRVFVDGHSTFFLRLVGYPDKDMIVMRQQPLMMTNVRGQTFQAPDSSNLVFTDNSVPDSVGQYDIAAVVTQLSTIIPLKLTLPTTRENISIAVTPSTIKEWQIIADM